MRTYDILNKRASNLLWRGDFYGYLKIQNYLYFYPLIYIYRKVKLVLKRK
jgi:hypothetical protein